MAYLKKNFQREITFCICGDAYSESDLVYKNNLIALVKKLNLENQIHFQNSEMKENLPKFLNQSRVFVFPQKGSISKAAVEALSVGLPIIITEESSDYLGEKLNRILVTGCEVKSIAERVKDFLDLTQGEREILCGECRNLVLSKGTQQDLFIRMVSEIKKNLLVT